MFAFPYFFSLRFVYCPWCHWLWGGGFLYQWGCRDFAGGAAGEDGCCFSRGIPVACGEALDMSSVGIECTQRHFKAQCTPSFIWESVEEQLNDLFDGLL